MFSSKKWWPLNTGSTVPINTFIPPVNGGGSRQVLPKNTAMKHALQAPFRAVCVICVGVGTFFVRY